MTNSRVEAKFADCTGEFGIARWQAWSPGVVDAAGWAAWLDGDRTEAKAQPDVSFLPRLLRRRLDRSGRMAMCTAWLCAEGCDSVQLVFGSRHGALERTLTLFEELAREEPMSPTMFSLAVHNSVAGLFSIARRDRGAATALAAGQDTLAICLLEGANMIAEGAVNVLVTYAEDMVPAPYDALVATPAAHPFAISLLLTPVARSALRCRLTCSPDTPAEAPEAALIRFLTKGPGAAVIGVNQPWRLERCPDA